MKCGRGDVVFPTNGRGGWRKICAKCFNGSRRKTDRKSPGTTYKPRQVTFDYKKPNGTLRELRTPEEVFKTWPHVAAFDAEQSEPTKPEPRIEVVEETITRVEEHRLKKRVKSLEQENAEYVALLSDKGEYGEIIAEALAHQDELPRARIAPRERSSGIAEATPLVAASDWHVEHEIRPEQVAGRNQFNLEIANDRMDRFFRATSWGINHQRQVPFKIRDLILWAGGDFIQNFLHEDDLESNLLSPTEATLFAEDGWIRGLDHLLEDPELEQITIPCNDGNHGRLTKKLRAATRIENSMEVFLYAQLARHYKDEPRIRFILPTSQFTYLDDVYGRTIRFLHGDVFKWGGGVGGLTVPLFRAMARWESVKHSALTVMGHWHQRYCLPNVIVNGSLCGYDSYAASIGCSFEQPVQCMRILEPKRFSSSDIPLWVSKTSDDKYAL